jgi:hypothetical protein
MRDEALQVGNSAEVEADILCAMQHLTKETPARHERGGAPRQRMAEWR